MIETTNKKKTGKIYLKDVYQWLLHTRDAHGVYDKVGFKPVAHPDAWMEIRNNRPAR
jgi:hypothetical protein